MHDALSWVLRWVLYGPGNIWLQITIWLAILVGIAIIIDVARNRIGPWYPPKSSDSE